MAGMQDDWKKERVIPLHHGSLMDNSLVRKYEKIGLITKTKVILFVVNVRRCEEKNKR
jgi:hypothetical protein